MTVAQALSAIIEQFGIESFNHPDQIQSMVMDYTGSGNRETRLFSVACRKEILNLAQEMYASSDNRQSMGLAERAKSTLIAEFFMAEENAIICVNLILEGVGNEFRLTINQANRNVTCNAAKTNNVNGTTSLNTSSISDILECKLSADRESFQKIQAAEREGDLNAMIRLGECYQYGETVNPNTMIFPFIRRVLAPFPKNLNFSTCMYFIVSNNCIFNY